MSFNELFITKHCVNLQCEDRKKRKQSLEELYQQLDDYNDEELLQAFQTIDKHIWKCFYDKSESVREAAITLTQHLLSKLPPSEKHLLELVPITYSRLGEEQTVEQSEEIRLRLVSLLCFIVERHKELCGPYIEQLVQILTKTLLDSFPSVRKESCRCVCLLTTTIPRYFYPHSIKLHKPILQSFKHQHFRLRIAAIEALGHAVKFGNNKEMKIQEIFGSWAERFFDSTPAVRLAVIKVIGDLLVNLPDRYSYFTKLVPLMLTGLCDDHDELREEAWKLWSKAGEQYIEENNDELKEKMQFLDEKPEHYPANVARPNLGCRTLVQRNTCQITPALARELEDWKNDIRIKSAQLLCWLVLHNETNITQHTEDLLLVMYKVCNQKDLNIVDNVEKAAEYIAYFVPPESYIKLVIPILEESCSSGHLCVLSALLRGSQKKLLQPYITQIADFLAQDSMCRSRDSIYLMQLLKCCEAMLDVCGDSCANISEQLFIVFVTNMAITSHQEIVDTARELLDQLSIETSCCSESLYKLYIVGLLDKIEKSVEGWTSVSYERLILQLLLQESGPIIGLHIERLAKILIVAMKPEADPNIRLKLFTILSTLLMNRELNMKYAEKDHFDRFLLSIIQDVITPNLVWHAGRTAEALRTAAIACLYTTLIPPTEHQINGEQSCSLYFASTETIEQIFTTLLPLLLNSIEDDVEKTRIYSIRSVRELALICREREFLTPDHVNLIYPVLSKRLDDVSDDVRVASLSCLKDIYKNLPCNYDPEGFKVHLQVLYNAMLIHLDDHDERFQEVIKDVMKTVGQVAPKVLYDKLNATKTQFRNRQLCEDVLEHLKQCSISS